MKNKSKIFLVLFMLISIVIIPFAVSADYQNKYADLSNYYVGNSVEYEDDYTTIIGNKSNISNADIKEIQQGLTNETVVIIYFNNSNVQNVYDCYIYNYELIIYSLKNGVVDEKTYSIDSVDFLFLKNECITIYNQFISNKISENNMFFSTQSLVIENDGGNGISNCFELFKSGSNNKFAKPYGYVYMSYNIYRYWESNSSSLYIIETSISYTCGAMAKLNGDSNYDNWYQKVFSLQVQASQLSYYDYADRIRTGGTPILKDYWPINQPATVTVTSSYGESRTIGFSFVNGFSKSSGYTVQGGYQYSNSVQHIYSKAYSNTEPMLSAQRGSSTATQHQTQWTYQYLSDFRNETGYANPCYMYEMNNSGFSGIAGEVKINFNIIYKFGAECTNILHMLFNNCPKNDFCKEYTLSYSVNKEIYL